MIAPRVFAKQQPKIACFAVSGRTEAPLGAIGASTYHRCNLAEWRGWEPDGRVCRRSYLWLQNLMPYKFNQARRHKIPNLTRPDGAACAGGPAHPVVNRSTRTSRSKPDWRFAACSTSRFGRPSVRCAQSLSCSAFRSESPTKRHPAVEAAVCGLCHSGSCATEPLHVLVDSSGVKVHGEGE